MHFSSIMVIPGRKTSSQTDIAKMTPTVLKQNSSKGPGGLKLLFREVQFGSNCINKAEG